MKLFKLAKCFEIKLKKLATLSGKDYIKQKPDGSLHIDGKPLDRDKLNSMRNWEGLVDLGLSRSRVTEIVDDYHKDVPNGLPENIDTWLENNSVGHEDPDKKEPGLTFNWPEEQEEESQRDPGHSPSAHLFNKILDIITSPQRQWPTGGYGKWVNTIENSIKYHLEDERISANQANQLDQAMNARRNKLRMHNGQPPQPWRRRF